MKNRHLQRGLLGLCVLIFAIGRMLLPTGLVVCEDHQGGSRIELGCSKTTDGLCAVIGIDGDLSGGDATPPCEDTPIDDDPAISKIPQRLAALSADVGTIMPPVLAADLRMCDRRSPVSRTWARDPRPPDEVLRLRTVVLVM